MQKGANGAWPGASTICLYGDGQPLQNLLLKDNYGWSDGGILRRSLMGVGTGHPQVYSRHRNYGCWGNSPPSDQSSSSGHKKVTRQQKNDPGSLQPAPVPGGICDLANGNTYLTISLSEAPHMALSGLGASPRPQSGFVHSGKKNEKKSALVSSITSARMGVEFSRLLNTPPRDARPVTSTF